MRKTFVSSLLMMFAVLISVPTLSTPVSGQSALSEDQKAVVAFDIRMKKMLDGDFQKSMGGADAMQLPPGGPDIDPKTLERIFGVARLPDNVQTFMEMQGPGMETLPMDFYISIKFTTKDAAEKMLKEIKEGSDVVTIGNNKYFKPKEGEDAPDNLLAAQSADGTTVELGTSTFMTQASKKALFTQGLNSAWASVPDDNFRVAMDLAGASKLVTEAVEMGKQGGDAMTAGMLDLLTKANNLRFSMDMDKENILTLAATGKDSEGAEEIRGGLDGLLGMAKFAGMNGVNMIPDPEVQGVAKSVLNSLKATRKENEVTVSIPKPKGFNDAMKKLQEIIPMMMMGGGPGGPGGPDF